MTSSAQIRAISCTQCGAGLDVLGGGRVTTHICGYCGAELDALDNYRILKRFADQPRPQTPFRIGMEGMLQGVRYRVIGTLAAEENYHNRRWTWVDHMVFSDTHGYAFLSVEDGHLIFTRRYRKDLSRWVTVQAVEAADAPPEVISGGEAYRYYETSTSEITFAEGEFTWRPAVGARSTTISLLSDQHMLHLTETATEREAEQSSYLPQAETLASFGITEPLNPIRVHPLQPYVARRDQGFYQRAAAVFAGISVVLTLFMLTQGREVLAWRNIPPSDLPATVTLPLGTPGRLATIEVFGSLSNAWAFVEVELTDPEDQPVLIAGRDIEYYTGTDADGAWSEGNTTARFRFRPTQAGDHQLEVDVAEAGLGEDAGGGPKPALMLRASEGGSTPFWTGLATLLFAGVFAYTAAGPYLHRRKRWHGTDWTEED